VPTATYAVTIPIHLAEQVAKQVGVYNSTLYRYATPFSTQIIFRYLNGFDLEFSSALLAIAKGLIKGGEIAPPKFLVIVSLGRGGAKAKDDIEINKDLFEAIGDRFMAA
jgi:hypothetical protein